MCARECVPFPGQECTSRLIITTGNGSRWMSALRKFKPKAGASLQAMGQRTFAKGEGLPGRVWQNARGAWITTLTADTNFPRAQLAASLGLETGMAFPILLQDQVLGVLEFFTTERRAPDDDTM